MLVYNSTFSKTRQQDSGCIARKWLLVIPMGAFLLVCLLSVHSWVFTEGDERFYLDAAMIMMKTGDYLTPYYQDGQPRLIKPILAYWPFALSYRLFGINLFSSRLPSIFAALICLGLCGAIAQILFKRDEITVLAIAFLASTPNFFYAAMRSRPDMLLTLFMMLSLYGFCRIIFLHDYSWKSSLYAYMGAGLAVATKGFPGLFPIMFVFGFTILLRLAGYGLRNLLHWPSIFGGLIVSVAWYVMIIGRHGWVAWQAFFTDQVSEKVTFSFVYMLDNIVKYVIIPIKHFLPWTFILLIVFFITPKSFNERIKQKRIQFLFVIGFYALIVAAYTLGDRGRNRYVLPGYPTLSIAAAAAILNCLELKDLSRLIRRIIIGLLVLAVLACTISLTLAFIKQYVFFVILFSVCAIGISYAMRRTIQTQTFYALFALAMFQILLIAFWVVSILPTFEVTSFDQCYCIISAHVTSTDMPVDVGIIDVKEKYSTMLWILSQGNFRLWPLYSLPLDQFLDGCDALIVSPRYFPQIHNAMYKPCAFLYYNLTLSEWWEVLIHTDTSLALEARKQFFYVACHSQSAVLH
jgi:hypothetical protein